MRLFAGHWRAVTGEWAPCFGAEGLKLCKHCYSGCCNGRAGKSMSLGRQVFEVLAGQEGHCRCPLGADGESDASVMAVTKSG